jgi:hypothetical protein
MTPASLEARQSNARRSQGPETPEGVERIRAGSLRHGFYSQKADEALVALGEDPAELADLLASLLEFWAPKNAFAKRLVERQCRALWRMERADRIQESQTVMRVEEARRDVANTKRRLHVEIDTSLETLKTLAAAVANPEYYTEAAHLESVQRIFGSEAEGRPQDILTQLSRLVRPADKAADPFLEAHCSEVEPVKTAYEREIYRIDLGKMLADEIAEFEAAQSHAREEMWRFDSPFGYDALMAPQGKRQELMMRLEDSNFRQVWRISQMLMKLQNVAPAPTESQNEGQSGEVDENNG